MKVKRMACSEEALAHSRGAVGACGRNHRINCPAELISLTCLSGGTGHRQAIHQDRQQAPGRHEAGMMRCRLAS